MIAMQERKSREEATLLARVEKVCWGFAQSLVFYAF